MARQQFEAVRRVRQVDRAHQMVVLRAHGRAKQAVQESDYALHDRCPLDVFIDDGTDMFCIQALIRTVTKLSGSHDTPACLTGVAAMHKTHNAGAFLIPCQCCMQE